MPCAAPTRWCCPAWAPLATASGNLRALGLEEPILDAIRDGVPFLGICVGLQLLFEVSEEMGEHRGLGVLPGRVRRFRRGSDGARTWAGTRSTRRARALSGADVPDDSYAYFVHSYYVEPEDPSVVAATTDYGITYRSAIARGNLFAIQFHPEKSQDVGERILRNFCHARASCEAAP